MGKEVEVEGGEIAIENGNGDIAIIPKNRVKEAQQMIRDECFGCLDALVSELPKMADYADDGTVVSAMWKERTGKSWDKAKEEGLTDGSYESNMALRSRLLKGDFDAATDIEEENTKEEDNDISFSEAFREAREKQGGSGGRFEWRGKTYGTRLKGEGEEAKDETPTKVAPDHVVHSDERRAEDAKEKGNQGTTNVKEGKVYPFLKSMMESVKRFQKPSIIVDENEGKQQNPITGKMEPSNKNLAPDLVKKAEETRNHYDKLTEKLEKHVPKSAMSQIMGNVGEAHMAGPTEEGLEAQSDRVKDYVKNAGSYLNRKLTQLGIPGFTPDGEKIDIVPTEKVKEVKPVPDTFYEEIKVTKDTHNKAIPGAKLVSHRSQWDNSTGQTFYNTPVKSNKRDTEKEYENVRGVGHFILDASPLDGSTYMHGNNFEYIKNSLDKDEYIPIYENVVGTDGEVNMKYKKKSEMNAEELEAVKIFEKYYSNAAKNKPGTVRNKLASEYAKAIDGNKIKIVSPLRQLDFDKIDFTSSTPAKTFQTARYLKTKDGDETNLLFTNKEKDLYGRFDGVGVSFIFSDKYGNSITRDYSGSIKGIEAEGTLIKEKYGLKDGDLKVGYHDVGSFSARPYARDGKLSVAEFDNYNDEYGTGSALIVKGEAKDRAVPTMVGMEEQVNKTKK
jgi:hypothetical protein